MADIYDQHLATFANVSAYVIMKGAERVATIAFKFPRDGAGRLYVYVNWFGTEMVRGHANGYGYDKKTSACADAARKAINADRKSAESVGDPAGTMRGDRRVFFSALDSDDGYGWELCLGRAGFTVLQAV